MRHVVEVVDVGYAFTAQRGLVSRKHPAPCFDQPRPGRSLPAMNRLRGSRTIVVPCRLLCRRSRLAHSGTRCMRRRRWHSVRSRPSGEPLGIDAGSVRHCTPALSSRFTKVCWRSRSGGDSSLASDHRCSDSLRTATRTVPEIVPARSKTPASQQQPTRSIEDVVERLDLSGKTKWPRD
jgi:hypothetical protein